MKNLFIVLCFLFCFNLVGEVVKSSVVTKQIYSKLKVKSEDLHIDDSRYFAPTKGWIEKEVLKQCQGMINRYYLSVGHPNSNDCDNYSELGVFAAHIAYLHSAFIDKDAGVAVGEIWYSKDNSNAHSVNFALISLGDKKYDIVYFEANTGFVTLSDKEIDKIFYCRI